MAVLFRLSVPFATRDQYYLLDERVEQQMKRSGGPPPGLMAHVVYPEGDGFVVADVWRTEGDGRSFGDGVVRPLLIELGLTAPEVTVNPVWSFGRP